ncbi:unnamed protein product, partial [Ectocarpus sp. 13 AM-2016]
RAPAVQAVKDPPDMARQSVGSNPSSSSPSPSVRGGMPDHGGGSTPVPVSEMDRVDFSAWAGINAVELGQAANLFQRHWVEAGLAAEGEEDPATRNQVWFSWQVDVNEASVQLSQPPSRGAWKEKIAPGPSPSPSPPPASGRGGGAYPDLPPPPGRRTDRGSGEAVVLQLVISRARVRMGIRTEKGFVMSGSVHAVKATGVGGITCLTINPSVLWGGGEGGDGGGKSINHGEDSALNIFMDVKRTDRKASLASVAGEVEMEEQGDGAKLLKSKARMFYVYSMNLELVARMAHVELTVSPRLLSALVDFAHSSKVLTPGLLLPSRSPDLDSLRVLAAGCRACSTKGHVSEVLHARGTKDVDVRAAGFAIRFELEPPPPPLSSGTGAVRCPSPGWSSGVGGLPSGVRAEDYTAGPFVAETADAGEASARRIPHTRLELTVGCCIYQKGRYLLGHAEGGESTTVSPRLPPLTSSSSSRGPPPPPPPPPSAPQEKTGKEMGGGSGDDDREEVLKLGERRPAGYDSSAPGGGGGGGPQRLSPPQTPTSATTPVDGAGWAAAPHEGARATHWGGGPGPRPCEGALAIVQSLRVPLSDPHYFRVADLALSLRVAEEGPGKDAGEEESVQRRRRRQRRTPVVLGGQENTDEGWTGELLVTRCAVVGNPRQPGTRADAMLSRIRVEVSKEAVAAITLLTLSLKRAVAVPPAPSTPAFSRGLSTEGMEDCIPPPQILSPPWGAGAEDNATGRGRKRGDRAASPRSVASCATSATTGVGTGVANNWSGAVPLPRLALLSGLTTLRLNVSLAGVQARVLSRGLRNDDDAGPSGSDYGQRNNNTEGTHPQGVGVTSPFSPKDSRRHSGARAERARRCVRRVARQLVERVHPAAASTGYRQACRLFRDEMEALGYDQGAMDGVVEALLKTTARIRDPAVAVAVHEGSGKEAVFFHYPGSMAGRSGQAEQQQETTMPGRATVEEVDAPGERADVGELVEAGMAVLSDASVPAKGGSGSGGDGAVGEEPVLLDIAAVEASGLTLALTRLTYDTRFTASAEAIVVRDSDGIRILSAGRIGLDDGGDDGKRSAGGGTTSKGFGGDASTTAEGAASNKRSSVPTRLSVSRLKRHQARRGPERDATSARERIEAAAATLAENQKRETSALLISFVACDKRHIFGSGGDSPNVVAAVGRLAASASRGSAPPPEPGLLECLSRDRERRASLSIDQISFVAAPSGLLTAARAATSLEAAAAEAAAVALARPAQDDGFAPPGSEKRVVAASSRHPSVPVVLRPSVNTSVHLQVREFRSVLSLDSRPLASLSMTGLVFEASRSEWWDLDDIDPCVFRDVGETNGAATSRRPGEEPAGAAAAESKPMMPTVGWPGWTRDGGRRRTALGYVRASLQGLEVLDLTADGQLHNQVISHEGASPGAVAASPATANATAPPAAGAVAADQRASSEINASVRGLRVCFLHRFVAEVTKYFGPDQLGLVFAEIRRFGGGSGGGGGAVDTAGSEAENESVAVVMGEHDQAVPDKWSVVGSEDGGDGNSTTDRGDGGAARVGTPVSDGASGGGGGGGGGGKAEAGTGMRVTAVLQNLTVVIPRSTHSREAAAVKCEELVLEVRKKRGTWRLPVDTTNVASRRLERETRRGHRYPGPNPAAAPSSSPHGGGRAAAAAAAAAAGDAPLPPGLERGKFGVRPPPPIFIPRVSPSLLPSRLLPPQGLGTGTSAAASAEPPRRRLSGDLPGRVEESLDGTGHRGSVASTRRSILSFVSARSFRSVGDVTGEDDRFDLYPPDVDDAATDERSGSASGTDSDLDEFFDAMAEIDE